MKRFSWDEIYEQLLRNTIHEAAFLEQWTNTDWLRALASKGVNLPYPGQMIVPYQLVRTIYTRYYRT